MACRTFLCSFSNFSATMRELQIALPFFTITKSFIFKIPFPSLKGGGLSIRQTLLKILFSVVIKKPFQRHKIKQEDSLRPVVNGRIGNPNGYNESSCFILRHILDLSVTTLTDQDFLYNIFIFFEIKKCLFWS